MIETFGYTDTDEAVHAVTLTNGRLTARLLSYGGILQDLRLAGHDLSLVLGFDHFAPYQQEGGYIGRPPADMQTGSLAVIWSWTGQFINWIRIFLVVTPCMAAGSVQVNNYGRSPHTGQIRSALRWSCQMGIWAFPDA